VTDTEVGKERPPHLDRVAELIVTHSGGQRRGSGYRVTADAVLTAAHVVAEVVSVRVRFEPDLPGEWTVAATVRWVDPVSDLAVVAIQPRPDEAPVSAARFGRVGQRAAVLAAQAVGFPRWKMREDDDGSRYRDAHHAVGTVAALSNFREGTLEFELSSAPAPDAGASPWEGMSGAALWIDDRIVGVIARHHPGDGLGRLAVVRLERALDAYPPRTGAAELLPTQLPDVVPIPAEDLSTAGHRAQVADIAPERLYDRDRELAELVNFCAGEPPYADQPYLWWQAGPWAGKTALLSWFALHPPAGVDVVLFFITSRFAGQSDSDAFVDAVIGQLASLVGEPAEASAEPQARRQHLQRLLRSAARHCSAADRRLLLVVDGLDEDTGKRTAAGQPSIASLLPRRCPPALRVVVASRPSPELPNDVPGDHPLRRTTPRHLTVSPHAHHLEVAAKEELDQVLHGPVVRRDVLGLLTACGGGLTLTDLEQLTGRPRPELDQLMGGVLGRSVGSRHAPTTDTNPDPDREPAYLFAHETLRELAELRFGAALADHRERLHTWAASYRDRGWPPETPPYLLRGYPRLLLATADVPRLVGCATDPARHDWMNSRTGGDALAMSEIATAADLAIRQPVPDLGALLLLAVARDDLAERGEHVPLELPGAWAGLGRPDRANALAHSVTSPMLRSFALQRMIEAGGPHHANPWYAEVAGAAAAAIRAIDSEDSRAREMAELATAVASVGDHDRALRLCRVAEATARTVAHLPARDGVFEELTKATATAGDHPRAERLARAIEWPDRRATALITVASAVAAAGDSVHALELAKAAKAAIDESDPLGYAWDVANLLPPVSAAGDDHWYRELLSEAEAAAHEHDRAMDRASALARVASAAAAAGDHDRAVELAKDTVEETRGVIYAEVRSETLGELASAMVAVAHRDWYLELVSEAEAAAQAVTDPEHRLGELTRLVAAVAAIGDDDWCQDIVDEATAAARAITSEKDRADRLTELALAVAAAGDRDRAIELAVMSESAARGVLGSHLRPGVLSALAPAVATAGDHERAGRLARAIPNAGSRATALARVATAVAAAGNREHAIELLDKAETSARQYPHPGPMKALIEAVAAVGDDDRCRTLVAEAEQRARARTDSSNRPEALAVVATAAAVAGDRDRALRLAAEVAETDFDTRDGGYFRDRAQAEVVAAVAAAGRHDRAEQLAREITTNAYFRGQALVAVVAAVAVDDYRRAERLADEIAEPRSRVEALGELAAAVAAYNPEHAAMQVRRGETASGVITSTEQRARALGDLAARVANAGGSVPVRLLAQVINSNGWPTALPAVAHIDPAALSRLSDLLLPRMSRFPLRYQ